MVMFTVHKKKKKTKLISQFFSLLLISKRTRCIFLYFLAVIYIIEKHTYN